LICRYPNEVALLGCAGSGRRGSSGYNADAEATESAGKDANQGQESYILEQRTLSVGPVAHGSLLAIS
jgi:hypothetical protein